MSLIKGFAAKRCYIGLSSGQMAYVIKNGKKYDSDSARSETLINPAGHWQPVLNILRQSRQELAKEQRKIPAEIFLPSRWCKFMIIPWSDALMSAEKAIGFLRLQYMSLYGDSANEWTITTEDAGYGKPRLACAIEKNLLDELNLIIKETDGHCHSIEPVFSAAWRNFVKTSGSGHQAFSLIEADRLTFAFSSKGRINAVESHTCAQLSAAEIAKAWQRWTLRNAPQDEVKEIKLVNLSGHDIDGDMPEHFKQQPVPLFGLADSFGSIAYAGGK